MSAKAGTAADSPAGRLSPSFLDRLSKVLGMLGSAHDGEIAAAGRRAHLMITNAGWTRPELLGAPSAVQDCREARRMVETCLAQPADVFEIHETRFLKNVLPQLRRGRPLTAKQFNWLMALYERALAAGGAA